MLAGTNLLHSSTQGVGAPVLLLHGFGASSYSWRHLIGPLTQTNSVILIDLKGFGLSPKPKDGKYSILDQADLVYRFIRERQLGNLTLIGHSLGGAVALLTTLRLLESPPSPVTSLVLIDAAAYQQPLPGFLRALRTPLIGWLAPALVPPKIQVAAILRLAYHDPAKITSEQIDEYARPLSSKGARYALRQTAEELVPHDAKTMTARYPTIQVPTLLIWGREDRIVPLTVGQRLHEALPMSKLVIIDACGHIPHEESPEKVLSVLQEFLASLKLGHD
jgi:pimeloyl-ACP methyl ester carboxylesterase